MTTFFNTVKEDKRALPGDKLMVEQVRHNLINRDAAQ